MILSNLHIADDSANPPRNQRGHNPLAKIQPFIDMIKPRFHDAYNPGLDISVDEGCCPWKGHLHFRLYNPSKPAKFHIKLFQVSDPSTGYVIHFKVYTGKDSCWSEGNTSDDAHNTVTTKTVMTLCADAGVLDKGHHIYFDNYFTSVDLMSELFIWSTAACGTARSRTAGPQALQNKAPKLVLGPFEACVYRSGPVLAFKWRQNTRRSTKVVYMISTIHKAVERFTGKCDRTTGEQIFKPEAILDYTKKNGWG